MNDPRHIAQGFRYTRSFSTVEQYKRNPFLNEKELSYTQNAGNIKWIILWLRNGVYIPKNGHQLLSSEGGVELEALFGP